MYLLSAIAIAVLFTVSPQVLGQDICAMAGSDCVACSRLPGCGFCGDENTAQIGGWIFKQKGLGAFEGSSESVPRSREVDAVRMNNGGDHPEVAAHVESLMRDQRSTFQDRIMRRDAKYHTDGSTERIQSTGSNPGEQASAQPMSSVHLASFMQLDEELQVHKRRGCFNVTAAASEPSEFTCMDLRLSVCECDSPTVASLPQCMAVVAAVRTPVVVIAAALIAAFCIVGSAVTFQCSFFRCGKRF